MKLTPHPHSPQHVQRKNSQNVEQQLGWEPWRPLNFEPLTFDFEPKRTHFSLEFEENSLHVAWNMLKTGWLLKKNPDPFMVKANWRSVDQADLKKQVNHYNQLIQKAAVKALI